MRWLVSRSLSAVTLIASGASSSASYVSLPAGEFTSVLAGDGDTKPSHLDAITVRITPVTNAEFLAFTKRNKLWARGQVSAVFADSQYLSHWPAAGKIAPGSTEQPVTNVSWFAAQAFCEDEGGRLPTWLEWERIAAADAKSTDARADPAWRAHILRWYSTPTATLLADAGGAPNAYGVRDIHGLVWEWVDDFNALLVSADSRNQSDPDKLQFCGAGAISLKDRNNYAVLMRIALLSSLKAADTTQNLGFRCVRPFASSPTASSPTAAERK